MPTALITGASAGLGQALAIELGRAGLATSSSPAGAPTGSPQVGDRAARRSRPSTAVAGDVADPRPPRPSWSPPSTGSGRSTCWSTTPAPSGPPRCGRWPSLSPRDSQTCSAVNVIAPVRADGGAAARRSAPAHGAVLDISSDAAVEHYPGWGGLRGEQGRARPPRPAPSAPRIPTSPCYAVDPGRHAHRTCNRPPSPARTSATGRPPAEVVPALLDCSTRRPPSGRYRAGDGVAVRGRCAGEPTRSSRSPGGDR